MFEDFLNHKCDIFHIKQTDTKVGYGINAARVSERLEEPDLTDIPCHFHINSGLSILQAEPFARLDGTVKLALPFGTEIHENDFVRSHETGYLYRAELPRAIHGNHHLIVNLRREDGIKGAI